MELLERAHELTAVANARGRCVLVMGPAGAGKTALLEHARRHATTPVRLARGGPLERWIAFGGVRQLFPRSDYDDLDRELTLLVDDAHLLDPASLAWLAGLTGRIAGLPVALIIASETPLPATTTLTLRPLSAAALARLDADARALMAGDASAIVRRIESPALARAIAVAGGGTIAARLAGLDVRGAVEAAETLIAAGVLRGHGFAHPLVRDAVYGGIPAAERAQLHARAARLVSAPERAAAHLACAAHGETDRLDSLARLRLSQGRVGEALALARRRRRSWTLAAALAATGRTSEALDVRDALSDRTRPLRADAWGVETLGSLRTFPEAPA